MANGVCWGWLCLALFRPVSADVYTDQINSYSAEGRHRDMEMLLRQQLEIEPENLDVHFQLARVLAWQQKFAQAQAEYKMLLTHDPANADYWFGLGQVGVWQGYPGSVLTQIETAERLQPDNPEIWRLHIQALVELGDALSHWQAVMVQERAAELFPNLAWEQVQNWEPEEMAGFLAFDLSRSTKPMRNNNTELGASYDSLSRHKGFWRTEFFTVEHQFAAHESVYAGYLQTERFSLNDEQFLLGAYYPEAPNLILNMEVSLSPYATLLASDSLLMSLQWLCYPTWSLTGGYRRSDFQSGPLQQAYAGLEHYFGDFRAAFTFRATEVFYAIQYGQRLDLSYYYRDSSSVTLSYSRGAELGGFQGAVYSTQFLGLHGRHWLDQDWAVCWDLAFSQQGNAYSRETIGLGIRRVF